MNFHSTITDNKTGETLIDTDTCAIIGAIDTKDEGTGEIVLTNCNPPRTLCHSPRRSFSRKNREQ